MKPPYLHCTVCDSSFNSKQNWHHHLLQEGHLTFAKRNLPKWDEMEKSSALVVVGKLPVGRNDKVIKFLSKDIGTFVTNFVWWEQRPKIGFVQFESRDKVKDVMSSVKNNHLRINPDQLCFVKAAASYSEDEWKRLFPDGKAAFNQDQDDVVVLCVQPRNTTPIVVVDLDLPSPPCHPDPTSPQQRSSVSTGLPRMPLQVLPLPPRMPLQVPPRMPLHVPPRMSLQVPPRISLRVPPLPPRMPLQFPPLPPRMPLQVPPPPPPPPPLQDQVHPRMSLPLLPSMPLNHQISIPPTLFSLNLQLPAVPTPFSFSHQQPNAFSPTSFPLRQPNPFLQQPNPFIQQQNSFIQQQNPFIQQQNPFIQQPNSFNQQPSPFIQQPNPFIQQPSPFTVGHSISLPVNQPHGYPTPTPVPPSLFSLNLQFRHPDPTPLHQPVSSSPISHPRIPHRLPSVPKLSSRHSTPNRSPSPIFSSKEARLLSFLGHIRNEMEIPDDSYNMALEILKHLQETVTKGPQNEDTNLKAYISNTWMLKLQYKRPNKDNKPNDKNVGLSIPLHKERNYVPRDISQAELAQIGDNLVTTNTLNKKKHLLSYEIISNKMSGGTLEYHVKQPINGSPFSLVILTGKLQIGKVMSRQLIMKLMAFDFRYYPVLAVCYFWTQLNSIMVGNTDNETNARKGELANPGGLHWLLMVFFQVEGLIPKTSEILKEPHKPKILNEVDIGFSHSSQFAKQWREDRSRSENYKAEEVFTLLYKFFLFCGVRLGEETGDVILNTRDSEILARNDLLSTATKTKKATMTKKEVTIVRDSLKGNQDKIVVLHPFFLYWRFSTSNAEKAFRAMKTTGLRLKEYLEKGEVSGKELKLEGFINLLKV